MTNDASRVREALSAPAGRTLSIELPLPARTLCANGPLPASRGGKIGRSTLVAVHRSWGYHRGREALELVGHCQPAFRVGPQVPYFPRGVTVRATLHVRRQRDWAARRLDAQNIIHGVKGMVDGLQEAAVIGDDAQIQWGDVTWESVPIGQGGLTLTLTAEGGQAQ